MQHFATPIPDWSDDDTLVSCAAHQPGGQQRKYSELMLAVLMLRIQDAIHAPYTNNPSEKRVVKERAIHWLLNNRRDFETMCDCAGIDPDWLRGKLRKKFAKN